MGIRCDYPAETTQHMMSAITRPTLTDRLVSRKAHLEKELEKVNKALSLMEAHEGVSEILDVISELGGF